MSRADSDAFVHIPMQVRRDMYRNRPFSMHVRTGALHSNLALNAVLTGDDLRDGA